MTNLTVVDARHLLDTKKISSVELTQATLDQINKQNEKVKAFLTVTEEEAIKQAKEADAQIAKGTNTSVLGIPYSLKDIFCTKGIKTTASSRVLEEHMPQYDATCHTRLQEAGAVLIGKTNCDAWGHGSSTENSDFGPSHNPWDLERTPGGSTGGSAAAVSAGMGLFSLGGDTGGSIRQPSSYCNTTGMKVSYGRVSRYGAIAFSSSLDVVGPMARTAADCDAVLQVISGVDKHDATTIQTPYTQTDRKIKDLSIGIPKEYFELGLDDDVGEIIESFIAFCKTQKIRTKQVSLPTTSYGVAAYYVIAPSETSSNLARFDGIRYGNDRSAFGAEAKRRIMIGTYTLSSGYYDQYYAKAQKARTMIVSEFQQVFEDVDLLLAPVSSTPPFKLGERVHDPVAMYLSDALTIPPSLAGLPSVSLPAGFTNTNLPVGVQVIGPQEADSTVLAFGQWYQKQTDWHTRVPNLDG